MPGPPSPAGLSGVTAIAAGYYHSLALEPAAAVGVARMIVQERHDQITARESLGRLDQESRPGWGFHPRARHQTALRLNGQLWARAVPAGEWRKRWPHRRRTRAKWSPLSNVTSVRSATVTQPPGWMTGPNGRLFPPRGLRSGGGPVHGHRSGDSGRERLVACCWPRRTNAISDDRRMMRALVRSAAFHPVDRRGPAMKWDA